MNLFLKDMSSLCVTIYTFNDATSDPPVGPRGVAELQNQLTLCLVLRVLRLCHV